MDIIPKTLRGRIGTMEDLAETPNGRKVLRFSVAENSSYKKAGEWIDREAVWTNCEAWEALAEALATNLEPGSPVLLVGEPRARTYETEDGEKRTRKFVSVFAGGDDYSQKRKPGKPAAADAPAEQAQPSTQSTPAPAATSDDPYDE